MDLLKYGVPKRSVLRLLLFVIFINFLVLIANTPDIVLFADEINVFFNGAYLAGVIGMANA